MATVSPPADQASDLLQNLSLDTQAKTLEIPEPNKKPSVYHYGSVDAGNAVNGQIPSYERSITPVLPEFMDPTMCYLPNGYPSAAYYYGGYGGNGNEWEDYSNFINPDAVDMSSGVYGDNGSIMYHHGYGFAPYAPYSPASTPVPTMGNDGQLYGPQHYQYPSFFPPSTPSSGPFNSTLISSSPGDVSSPAPATTDPKSLPVEGANAPSNGVVVPNGGFVKGNGSAPVKPAHQSTFNSNSSYGRNVPQGGFPASTYQDPRYSYDGYHTPIPWQDVSRLSASQNRPVNTSAVTTYQKANNVPSSRNQNQTYRSNSHYMGLHQPTPISGINTTHGYTNRMYPNKLYGQYGNNIRSGMGYGSTGYDMRANGRGWLYADNKYKPRGRGNYLYGTENIDGLNELNRGPRAKASKTQKVVPSIVNDKNEPLIATDSDEMDISATCPDREQYNKADFPEVYSDAKFFVIKSYSEDDVHKSIKYNVWASTPTGNKKLDLAYLEAQQKSSGCPVFLFFSVNTSGQFVGLAEMVGAVDFNKNVDYWQQDKWTGSFPLKWHIVKDVPNSLLKHITLENNENKPVTNSRDVQEVKIEQGLKLVKIFKDHASKTCILDDFGFYESRQKTILEKKAKQQQFQKQVWEGKPIDEKKEMPNGLEKLVEITPNLAKECCQIGQTNVDNVVSENGIVTKPEDTNTTNGVKQAVVSEKKMVANGISNGC